jgi:hypothetical protein
VFALTVLAVLVDDRCLGRYPLRAVTRRSFFVALSIVVLATSAASVSAQWPTQTDGPRSLSAPPPRLPNGRPDLSGVWTPAGDPQGRPGGIEGIVAPRYLQDVTRDVDASGLLRPWAETIYRRRAANQYRDNPSIRCLPVGIPRLHALTAPYKIVQTPDLVLILYELGTTFRQIFLDGRSHPRDPQPTWMGYSTGRWDGDALVVESVGFNDQTWLDGTGHPHSEQMRLTERFVRRSVGRMDIEITVDDPTAYTRPVRYVQPQELMPGSELIEYVCAENAKPVVRTP